MIKLLALVSFLLVAAQPSSTLNGLLSLQRNTHSSRVFKSADQQHHYGVLTGDRDSTTPELKENLCMAFCRCNLSVRLLGRWRGTSFDLHYCTLDHGCEVQRI